MKSERHELGNNGRELTPKDLVARWAVSLTAPLVAFRVRHDIDAGMRRFSTRMSEYHAVIMAGLLADTISTLDPEDPWKNPYRAFNGSIRVPGGNPLGAWKSATDLMPASNADIAEDVSLAPLTEHLRDQSSELYFRASESWESARAYLLELSLEENPEVSIFDIAEDAMRWALLRRQAYALDGDGYFPINAVAWSDRTPDIVEGKPFDESRWLRLRTGATVTPGTYEKIRLR
jgi:hypothetical protein